MSTVFITGFDDIEKIICRITKDDRMTDNEMTTVKAYICLSWLGLSSDEIKKADTSDYNSMMRILNCGDRNIYVKDDAAAELLGSIVSVHSGSLLGCSHKKCGEYYDFAEKKASQYGASNKFIYKMRFFFEKYELKQNGQPEDKIRFKEIINTIGEDEKVLMNEFEQYEQFVKSREKAAL